MIVPTFFTALYHAGGNSFHPYHLSHVKMAKRLEVAFESEGLSFT